jgi:hypothetical protein
MPLGADSQAASRLAHLEEFGGTAVGQPGRACDRSRPAAGGCRLPAGQLEVLDTLDRNQAITALTLSEVSARRPKPGDRIWGHVEGWAAELGLSTGGAAIGMARAR